VFTGRYALSPYIKQIRFVFKGSIRFGEPVNSAKKYNATLLQRPRFVRHLIYIVTHSAIPNNSTYDTCFSATLSTTYARTSTSRITTLPVIGSNTVFKEVVYFEKSSNFSSLTMQACNIRISNSCINSRSGKWKIIVNHVVHKVVPYLLGASA
jgi:hypothetical protein